ncbi:MAG: hypothetical protein C0490_27185, partial [Marivirga sp.]|nr:hypothetical protein [Marivirga sp.]
MNTRMKVVRYFSSVKYLLLLIFLVSDNIVIGQDTSTDKHRSKTSKQNKVRLIAWKSLNCDNTYDPYRLISRITDFEVRNGQTFLSVNFSDNCCAEFSPKIEFKENKLILKPYEEYSGGTCDCNCCFTIQFQIEGLPEQQYEVYFTDKKIEQSETHYKIIDASYEEYNGQIINRRNKYGFNEGIWLTFYDDGKVRQIFNYPEQELYREPSPIWRKEFYSSGALSYFDRNDTTESWFEDGELRARFIELKKGDTTYSYQFIKHTNRNLKEKSLKKSYPTIFKSDFDPEYRGEGSVIEIIYKEEYFENKRLKYLYGRDTSYSWYESGQIESKQ